MRMLRFEKTEKIPLALGPKESPFCILTRNVGWLKNGHDCNRIRLPASRLSAFCPFRDTLLSTVRGVSHAYCNEGARHRRAGA